MSLAPALADTEVFDLAYLPACFVPEDSVVVLPRIRVALRPGGWVFVRPGTASEPTWREP